MSQSRVSRAYLAMFAAGWGIIILAAPFSFSQDLQRLWPVVQKTPAQGPAKSDDTDRTPDEVVTLQEHLKTVTAAYQTLKTELAPRLAEAQAWCIRGSTPRIWTI